MYISEGSSVKESPLMKKEKKRHHLNHSLSIFDKFDYEKKVEAGILKNYLQPYKISDKIGAG